MTKIILVIPKKAFNFLYDLLYAVDTEFVLLFSAYRRSKSKQKIIIEIEDIYYLKQTNTRTSTEIDEREMATFIENHKELFTNYDKIMYNEKIIGWIHSHNTMGAFFSSIDKAMNNLIAGFAGFSVGLVISRTKDQKLEYYIEYTEDGIKQTDYELIQNNMYRPNTNYLKYIKEKEKIIKELNELSDIDDFEYPYPYNYEKTKTNKLDVETIKTILYSYDEQEVLEAIHKYLNETYPTPDNYMKLQEIIDDLWDLLNEFSELSNFYGWY